MQCALQSLLRQIDIHDGMGTIDMDGTKRQVSLLLKRYLLTPHVQFYYKLRM